MRNRWCKCSWEGGSRIFFWNLFDDQHLGRLLGTRGVFCEKIKQRLWNTNVQFQYTAPVPPPQSYTLHICFWDYYQLFFHFSFEQRYWIRVSKYNLFSFTHNSSLDTKGKNIQWHQLTAFYLTTGIRTDSSILSSSHRSALLIHQHSRNTQHDLSLKRHSAFTNKDK